MSQQSQGPDVPSGSLGGVMRMIAAAMVLALAIAGVLVVLDVVQLDEAGRAAGKVLVVMISDLSAPAHRDYALAAGVDLFLEKWLAPTRLAPLVEQLCPLPSGERRPGSGSIPQAASA